MLACGVSLLHVCETAHEGRSSPYVIEPAEALKLHLRPGRCRPMLTVATKIFRTEKQEWYTLQSCLSHEPRCDEKAVVGVLRTLSVLG